MSKPKQPQSNFQAYVKAVAMMAVMFVAYVALSRREGPNRPSAELCLKNVRQLAGAANSYATDHDGYLPAAANWMTASAPYLKGKDVTRCPSAHPQKPETFGYAANDKAVGLKLSDIENQFSLVWVFDSSLLTENAVGGLDTLPKNTRHGGVDMMGFVDGHALKHKPSDGLPESEPKLKAATSK